MESVFLVKLERTTFAFVKLDGSQQVVTHAYLIGNVLIRMKVPVIYLMNVFVLLVQKTQRLYVTMSN